MDKDKEIVVLMTHSFEWTVDDLHPGDLYYYVTYAPKYKRNFLPLYLFIHRELETNKWSCDHRFIRIV